MAKQLSESTLNRLVEEDGNVYAEFTVTRKDTVELKFNVKNNELVKKLAAMPQEELDDMLVEFIEYVVPGDGCDDGSTLRMFREVLRVTDRTEEDIQMEGSNETYALLNDNKVSNASGEGLTLEEYYEVMDDYTSEKVVGAINDKLEENNGTK